LIQLALDEKQMPMNCMKPLLIWKLSQRCLNLPYLFTSSMRTGGPKVYLLTQQHGTTALFHPGKGWIAPMTLTSQGTKRQTYRWEEYYQVVAHAPSMLNCAIVIPTIALVLPPSSLIKENSPQLRS